MADFHLVLSLLFGKIKCPVRFKGEADRTFRYFNQRFHITCIWFSQKSCCSSY